MKNKYKHLLGAHGIDPPWSVQHAFPIIDRCRNAYKERQKKKKNKKIRKKNVSRDSRLSTRAILL